MTSFKNAVAKFTKDESGATMVEYAVMVALIAAICIAVITTLGKKANNAFSTVNASMT